MAPPTETIVAAVQTLRDDAHTWRASGAELDGAARAAAALGLDAYHFSYLGDQVGLAGVYQRLHAKMGRLLGEAAVNCVAVAGALEAAAAGYERDERDAIHQLAGVW
jgi:hypothetical protein